MEQVQIDILVNIEDKEKGTSGAMDVTFKSFDAAIKWLKDRNY